MGRTRRERACGPSRRPKIRHESEAEAVEHLVRMAADFPEWSFNVYQCGFCSFWHVGRTGPKPCPDCRRSET